ncbi:restriction endonuclease subunit S [Bifidobacterium longum]|uniref:restriction endonuclease subunit S n=1 Tax=Bifidobacterium longum TaxID=216816 RepID=UPI001E2C9333|nr:restriction endonuclease subunit S [Bifidobacterium longum]
MMVAPKLRFKADDGSAFPEWEEKTLGDIVERVTRKNRDNQTDVPLTISSLDGLVDQRDYFKKTVASKDMSGYFLLQNGEFAYNKSYSVGFDYGSIKRLDRYPCGALSTLYICFGLKPNVDIDSDYLTHYFDSQKWNSEVAAICAEGARNHGLLNVSTSDFFDINIMSPSLPEQRKIAALLSSVDAVIAAQQAEVDAWEQRKKGVMQKLFSQEVRFKADDGSEFPEWEEKTLGELGTFTKGAALSKADISDDGRPLILYGELYTTYNEVAVHIVRHTEQNVADRFLSRVGDVLIPTSGETAEEIATATCVMQEGVVLAGDLYIYRTVDELDGRIASYLLNHSVNKKISNIAQGKSVVHIQAKELSKVIMSYPASLEEQRKIADCLASMDEVIRKAKDELAKWQELKKGLLQQMFV